MRITQLLHLVLLLLAFMLPVTTLASNDKDPGLESALDNYVQLGQSDQTAAKALLHDLWQQNETNPAVQSWARLASYMTSESFDKEKPEKMQALLQQMLQKAETTENPDAFTEIYGTELHTLFVESKINEAVIKADTLQFYLQRATEPRIRYFFNSLLGYLFRHDSQYSRALKHYIAGLDAVLETDNEATARRRTALNVEIAHVHVELKNWSQASEIAKTALDDAIKYGFKRFVMDMYILQSYIAGYEKRFEDAVQINKLGAAYAQEHGDEYVVLTFENNLASSYVELDRYDAAKVIFMQALERAERLDEYSIELIKFNLAYIQVLQGEHQAGLTQMNAGMKYFSEKDSKAQFEPNYEWLAKAYAAAGMHKEQAETLLKQMALQEEIRSNERENKLNELQNRYDRKMRRELPRSRV